MNAHDAASAADRTFFRDLKPYEVVDSLDQLAGPASGVVELPHSVFWAPGGSRIDLDEPGSTAMAYQAVLSEGTATDQCELLNRHVLLSVWKDLMLPQRVRELWEARFPGLGGPEAGSPSHL